MPYRAPWAVPVAGAILAAAPLLAACSTAAAADSVTAAEAPARAEAGQPVASEPVRIRVATGDVEFDNRVRERIRELASPSFAVRQRASRLLVEMGIAAQPLLAEAQSDEDAEVRNRAAYVLRQVLEADFLSRLEAFANDPEGRGQYSLPSWNRFRESYGDDKAARSLFVDMQRAEPGLLSTLETNEKLAAEMLVVRVQSLLQSVKYPQTTGFAPAAVPLGSVCAALFASSCDGVSVGDQDASELYILINQPAFQSSLKMPGNSLLLRKLLGQWILHNSGSAIAYQNLMLAFNFDLPEGLDVATRLIRGDGAGQPYMKQYVILAIGRFGNHEHMPLLEPLLKDASPCMPQQTNDPKQSQIRDVALAVLVRLSGQELKDYNLDHVPTNSQMIFQPGMVTFADAAKRDAALAKWEKWATQHVAADRPAGDTPR